MTTVAGPQTSLKLRLCPGDCREVLPRIPDSSVDAVVTDPPYELGFMGKRWDASGIAYDVGVWRECLRVLKPGGYLLAFGGTRTYHRLACAVEDAGFEIRDSLHWIYGSGFPKGKACLKPAHEPIVLARKTAGRMVPLNIDGCRVECAPGESWNAGPGGGGFTSASYERGLGRVQPSAGRWPPNILLTHSADCQPAGVRKIKAITGTAAGKMSGKSTDIYGEFGGSDRAHEPTGYADADGTETVEAWDCAPGCPVVELDAQSGSVGAAAPVLGTEPSAAVEAGGVLNNRARVPGAFHADAGGASRFFPSFAWDEITDIPFLYQAKAPKKERPVVDGLPGHPTVKPLALMRWLTRLVTLLNGVVLDPFAGTGTTGQACLHEGFRCILIENDPDSIRRIEKRLESYGDWITKP